MSDTHSLSHLRRVFPALSQTMNGRPLVYLDSAATALKPKEVIEAQDLVYERDCANVHRSAFEVAARATAAFEAAREKVASLLGCPSSKDLVFVKGATEGINLVAQSLGRTRLREGDEIVVTALEHHANIVPWQLLCEQTGASLRVVDIEDDGSVTEERFASQLSSRTKIAAFTHVSNALGNILPAKRLCSLAHDAGAVVLIDGAQAVPHVPVDVVDLDCDFYVFSGHKLYGPTGIGALYGRSELLEQMPPYQGGGEMIDTVSFEKTTFAPPPLRFEAGTPNIAGAVGLGAAVDFVNAIGFEQIRAHEVELVNEFLGRAQEVRGMRLFGGAEPRVGAFSFAIEGAHATDIGMILDKQGVAIRTGHHCAQPLMRRLGVPATARASLGLYNDKEDIARFFEALDVAVEMLA